MQALRALCRGIATSALRSTAVPSAARQSLVCTPLLIHTQPSLSSGVTSCVKSLGVRLISIKRRRVVKMNKHKLRKLRKRMRCLTAKNLKGNN